MQRGGDWFKIFDNHSLDMTGDVEEQLVSSRWGDLLIDGNPNRSVSLTDATKIQNYCAIYDLAPQVYEILIVRLGTNYYPAQRIQMLQGVQSSIREAYTVYEAVKQLGDKIGFTNDKDDVSDVDVVDGRLVDFNTFHFTSDHKKRIEQLYIEQAKYGKIYYHDIPEWKLVRGPRDNKRRIGWLGLDDLILKDKVVLDIGCAGGYFTRYAHKQGAWAVGIDTGSVIEAAKIASIDLGYWDNIDFIDHDLKDKPKYRGDVTLFLSMTYHIGVPDWLPEVTGELCIVEDNSKERDAVTKLQKLFGRVILYGYTKDRNSRLPIYYCYC